MFWGALRFNQSLGTWNTVQVEDLNGMFYAATSFNQPIGTWNTTLVTGMTNMFGHGSGLSTSNYNQLLIGWAARPQTHHVHFDAGHSTYNAAARAACNTLRVKDVWTIVDGGVTMRKAKPQIIRPPSIAPITYGQVLPSANLIDGLANTRGRFFLTRSPLALNAGTHRLTVIFRPAQPAYYTTATSTVLVRVNPRPLTLGLTGLTTTPHGQSVTVTVLHLIPGAKVTVGLQPSGGPATYTHVVAKGVRASVALRLPTIGTYTVAANATRTNYVFTGATGLVTAT